MTRQRVLTMLAAAFAAVLVLAGGLWSLGATLAPALPTFPPDTTEADREAMVEQILELPNVEAIQVTEIDRGLRPGIARFDIRLESGTPIGTITQLANWFPKARDDKGRYVQSHLGCIFDANHHLVNPVSKCGDAPHPQPTTGWMSRDDFAAYENSRS